MRPAGVVLTFAVACTGSAPTPPPAPVAIEASPDPRAATARPFDAGRADLRRCLERATCGEHCAERCRAHDHDACLEAAKGSDPGCRRSIADTACGLGHNPSCLDLGLVLSSLDPPGARRPLERACNGGLAEGCVALGRVEWLDPERRAQAVARFEQGCALRVAEGCAKAGEAYRTGQGVDRDVVRGLELMEQACQLGEGAGCYDLARLMLADPNQRPQAIALLEDICLNKPKADGQACFHLFTLMPTPHAKSTQPDDVLMKACEKGHTNACARAAENAYGRKDWPRVIAASNTLIERGSTYWVAWFRRAMSKLNLGQPKAAVPDLEQLCLLRRDWLHCELWLWAARERSGVAGNDALRARRKTVDPATWPAPVMAYFLGGMSEAQLLARAKNPDARIQKEQLCEAHYYIGMRRLVRGDAPGAKRAFEKTVQFRITSFIEHMRALAELDRLASGKP